MKTNYLVLLSCLCASPGHAAEGTKPPSDHFEPSHWKLTLPVDADGAPAGNPMEISPAQLNEGYTHSGYFYTGCRFADSGECDPASCLPKPEIGELLA